MKRPDDRARARAFTGRACPRWRSALRALADGVATLDAREALEAHAADCARCAGELRTARRMRALLDGVTAPEATAAEEERFVADVLARIADEAPGGARPVPGGQRGARPTVLRAVALAAAAALAAIALWPRPDEDSAGPRRAPSTTDVAASTTSAAESDVRVANGPDSAGPGSEPERDVPADRTLADAAARERAPLSIEVAIDARPIDLDAFGAALLAAAEHTGFDPDLDLDGAPFLRELALRIDADQRRAARAWLTRDAANALDALAVRVLGRGADFRDRGLVTETLERTGRAGLLAIAARGDGGVGELWGVAAGESKLAGAALDVLTELEAAGLASSVERAPAGVDAALVARVALAGGRLGADALLERYLASDDAEWRNAWNRHADAERALAQKLDSTARRSDVGPLLDALRLRPIGEGLDFVLEALRRGHRGAPNALASYAAKGGADALIAATRSGLLPTAAEDEAWSRMVSLASDAVLAAAVDSRAALLVAEAIARASDQRAVGQRAGDQRTGEFGALESGALTVLLGLAERADLAADARAEALVVVAEHGVVAAEQPRALERVAPLCTASAPTLAAAAWLAWHRLGATASTPGDPTGAPKPAALDVPPAVAAVFVRGGTPHVVRLRLERALARSLSTGTH